MQLLKALLIHDGLPFLDLEKNIAGINEDLKNFQSTLNFASEIQSVAEVKWN